MAALRQEGPTPACLAGEVADIIGSTNFHPQAAAFTSLLHMCAKSKHWDKALEVFEGMKKYHPAVVPNTVHFSSLISACGTAGRWREAMEVGRPQLRQAEGHGRSPAPAATLPAMFVGFWNKLAASCSMDGSEGVPEV